MKSYVSIEQAVCPVCGTVHDTGSILMDRRLKESMEHTTVTHWAMCPEHQKLKDEGYIALVGCNNQDQPTLETADRTGHIAHIRSSVWEKVFNVPVPAKGMAFVSKKSSKDCNK